MWVRVLPYRSRARYSCPASPISTAILANVIQYIYIILHCNLLECVVYCFLHSTQYTLQCLSAEVTQL